MDKDKAMGGGLLGDRADGRTEVASLEELLERARALGFSEAEIEEIAKRYGWSREANADVQVLEADKAGFLR
jgi:microsomal dipeptidase-like Zn-dependent dipeptidase